MTKKCKRKCKKDPVVVIIDTHPYGGTFCDFLNALNPELRCKYCWIPFYANTDHDVWVDELKCKLQQVCKKYCKKPIVVSTLFSADLEAKLSMVQIWTQKIWLASTARVLDSSFSNNNIIPVIDVDGVNLVIRSNDYYKNMELPNGGYYDKLISSNTNLMYGNGVVRAMADKPIQTITDLDICKSDVDYSNYFYILDEPNIEYAKTLDFRYQAPTLSDAATFELIKKKPNYKFGYMIDESDQAYLRILYPESFEDKYFKIYQADGIRSPDALSILAQFGGFIVTKRNVNQGIIEVNQALCIAKSLKSWISL